MEEQICTPRVRYASQSHSRAARRTNKLTRCSGARACRLWPWTQHGSAQTATARARGRLHNHAPAHWQTLCRGHAEVACMHQL